MNCHHLASIFGAMLDALPMHQLLSDVVCRASKASRSEVEQMEAFASSLNATTLPTQVWRRCFDPLL